MEGYPQSYPPPKPHRGSSFWRIFKSIVLVLSVILNVFLIILLAGTFAMMAASRPETYREKIIQPGPERNKIAVINISGMIDDRQWSTFKRQIDMTRADDNVRGLIVRVSSPGGLISSSDRIYNELLRYRSDAQKPTLAFMEDIATSGGYYTALGCESIMAEPTAVTGSIGAVMYHFAIEELLEQKLGITPTVIKSGERKDWPGVFKELTDEQQQYIEDKLITPFHERFVEVLEQGRETLDMEQALALSDGSIFNAQEAMDKELIDSIGYLDDAVEVIMEMAEIEDARVVEYRRPFAFGDIFFAGAEGVTLTRTLLHELAEPRLMYLWSPSGQSW